MNNQNTNPTGGKRLPTWAIVLITLAAIFIILPISCTACGAGCVGCAACAAAADETLNEGNEGLISEPVTGTDTVADKIQSGSGTLSDYAIEIQSAYIGEDYEGNPALIVTYSFTNNSDDAASFYLAFSDSAFQNGIQLEPAIIIDDDNFDSTASMLEIKSGASLTVQQAYLLRDTTSPVDIEVSELFSFDDAKVVKQFTLGE